MYLLALWALLQTEMTDVPSFSYTKKNPYPLIYVKHEKGTPFGRSLDSYAIIESTPPPPPPPPLKELLEENKMTIYYNKNNYFPHPGMC